MVPSTDVAAFADVLIPLHVQIAVPLAFGVAALIAGQLGGGLMMLAMAGLAALMFYYWYVLHCP